MLRSSIALVTMLAALSGVHADGNDELCALPTASLVAAASQFQELNYALSEVNKHAIATWYTDRNSPETATKIVQDITKHCSESTRMTLVVYGLPNKDCDAGYSSGGFNKNAEDYRKWIQVLADGVGQRKVLYVVEPDAVGLLAKGGCGAKNGYAENVKTALSILSKNPNADIYMDIGYWTLMSESDAQGIAKIVQDLKQAGRLKGIALNTSNYRSNKQISELCGTFQRVCGDASLHCIVDTSRNFNDPQSSEWCNANFAGVGRPPTRNTGFNNLDYFIWIKPAGESDGTCDGGERSGDAMKGPAAGQFFKDHFVKLWNNGFFVKEKGYPVIGAPTPAPNAPASSPGTPSNPGQYTQAPSTQTPAPTEPPKTWAPSTNTSAPTNSPAQYTPSPASTDPSGAGAPTTPAPVPAYPTNSPGSHASEYEDVATPTPTPSKKKCVRKERKETRSFDDSDAATNESEELPAGVKAPDAELPISSNAKTVTFSTENEVRSAPESSVEASKESTATPKPSTEPSSAPETQVGQPSQVNRVTTSTGNSAPGVPGGVLAAAIVAGVLVIAIGAIVVRRHVQRRSADALPTPDVIFGHVRHTPGNIAVI